MYKDKSKQKEYQKKWVRQKRGEGSTDSRVRQLSPDVRVRQGSTKVLQGRTKAGGMTEIVVSIEKAAKLKMICDSFLVKPSGKYLMSLCWYGGLRLDQIAKQLL